MQTIEGFINNENKNIDTTVDDYFIKEAYKRLKVSLEYFMTEPRTHLETYSMFLKFYFKSNLVSFFVVVFFSLTLVSIIKSKSTVLLLTELPPRGLTSFCCKREH